MEAWLTAHRGSASLAIVALALVGAAVFFTGRGADRPLLATVSPAAAPTGQPKAYISGEVARPGVYAFRPGDRVEQLVAIAGGFTDRADAEAVNLALRLRDEQQVHVPRRAEDGAPGQASPQQKLVDLNAATLAELEALPGIGSATAQRIVEHRTKVGPFAAVDDLLTLRLVSSSTMDKIRSLVTVR